ncbi:Gar1/Naf1 RNA binding region-domain-containing protein [Neohortaea acidophila]|uniref:H/ACA ribonucleoprotein complex non-core subunit NAF1 n=1 Tax=Neohortaea acidophila TaxID=245834 RepID=A0A6A6Q5U1_9PEZI|nr:Gar1/Naf1 RNA binding region-domain-containing protein [Neohortaea acidophila]KAF2487003.1 Gar1/Naf1 RNA binding region-domain-containing protein [Neohortaea acidophila]
MENDIDLQQPDEARPAKRARLDAPLHITEEVQEEIMDDDDWDDVYGLSAQGAQDSGDGEAPHLNGSALLVPNQEQFTPDANATENGDVDVVDDIPSEAIEHGNDLVTEEHHIDATDPLSAQVMQETTQVETSAPHFDKEAPTEDGEGEIKQNAAIGDASAQPPIDIPIAESSTKADEEPAPNTGEASQPTQPPKDDPEFLAAAAAQKETEKAEWQFDSSDGESSDSDSSSDDSSDDSDEGSEDGYEMLDAATAAKILMAGEGDDEDGGRGKGASGDHQPRTTNEVKEETVQKPDVVVTEDMKITSLGKIDSIVDKMILVKAVTTGEYQVLEYGSVLCLADRKVIGAVADTIGRVQEPMYSVAFANQQEIEDAALQLGTEVFYVDSHSSFVFTQPLKNLKGTDASNIHDEEVGEDDLEFSDDEKEAEYKRMKKYAKKEGRDVMSRGAFNEARAHQGSSFGAPGHDSGYTYVRTGDAPTQQYGGDINYDDEDVKDGHEIREEFYSPLKRPDNLSQLMAAGGPPRPPLRNFERGRGRGRGDRGRGDRGRGRGDRGRGRGGFDQRGGRGGYGQDRGGFGQDRGGPAQQSNHRGPAHSFPDRHNEHRQDRGQHHSSPPQQQRPASRPPHPTQQAPSPQTYQFNGYNFQYGIPPAQPPVAQAAFYNAQMPPTGSYVNPAFFQGQQMQWSGQPQQSPQAQQRQPPNYASWPQHPQMPGPPNAQHPSQAAAYGAPSGSPALPNLADIFKQLGGPQQPPHR